MFQSDHATIRKLHRNLGHPTSERLANHVANQKARVESRLKLPDITCVVNALREDLQKLNPPGQVKDKLEFNTKVWIDRFECKSAPGLKAYVCVAIYR